MNKNITSFFVVNKNNETVAYGSNLKECLDMFFNIDSNHRNYMYYYRRFQKDSFFIEGSFYFQQLV